MGSTLGNAIEALRQSASARWLTRPRDFRFRRGSRLDGRQGDQAPETAADPCSGGGRKASCQEAWTVLRPDRRAQRNGAAVAVRLPLAVTWEPAGVEKTLSELDNARIETRAAAEAGAVVPASTAAARHVPAATKSTAPEPKPPRPHPMSPANLPQQKNRRNARRHEPPEPFRRSSRASGTPSPA